MKRLQRVNCFCDTNRTLVVVGLRLCGADGIQLIKEFRRLNPVAAILPFPSTLIRCRLNARSGRVREHT